MSSFSPEAAPGSRPLASGPLFLLSIFGVFVLANFWLRISFLVNEPFNLDEAHGAVTAVEILNGGIPYRDLVIHRGPLTDYFFAAVFSLFEPYNYAWIHGALCLAMALAAAMIYFLGRILSGHTAGLFGGLIFSAAAFFGNSWETLAFHTEHTMILFTLPAALVFITSLREFRAGPSMACGALLGLAFFSKQPAIMDLGAMLLFLAVLAILQPGQAGRFAGKAVWLMAGFLAVTLSGVSFFWNRGALAEFYHYFFGFNLGPYFSAIAWKERLSNSLGYPFLASGMYAMNPWVLPLALVYAGGFLVRKFGRSGSRLETAFVMLWALMAYAGASLSGRNFGHYHFQELPAVCLLAGLAMERLFAFGQKRLGKKAMVTIALVLWVSFLTMLSVSLQRQTRPLLDPAVKDAAGEINLRSSGSDRIFVWGVVPEIYGWAKRRPASRFGVANFLTGLIPWANTGPEEDTTSKIEPGAWGIFMSEMALNRPLYIVDTSPGDIRYYKKYPPEEFPALRALLEKEYFLEKTVLFSAGPAAGTPLIRLYRRRNA